MTTKKIVTALVLADFAALNAYALYAEGLGGLATFLGELGPWGWVLAADLLIALGMVVAWMWNDAREKKRNALGYTLLTLGTGSIGPLAYILTGSEERSTARTDREEFARA